MPSDDRLDATDARLLLALAERPEATVVALAAQLGLSRNTVHSRLARLTEDGLLDSFERRVRPRTLGYPLMAYVTAQVTQRRLGEVAVALEAIPEVLEVTGISGPTDLMIRVVATDADDLYRIAGQILAIGGIERTDTSLAMRELVSYRITPLLRRRADLPPRPRPSGAALADTAPRRCGPGDQPPPRAAGHARRRCRSIAWSNASAMRA